MRISDWSSTGALPILEEAKDAVQKRAVGRGLFPGDQIVAQRIQILVCHVEKIVKQIVHAALAPVSGTRHWTGDGTLGFKKIGRASCRERGGQSESTSVGADSCNRQRTYNEK